MKRLLSMLILAAALVAPQAHAGVIGTEQALQAAGERERVKAALERPEVVQALQKMGVDARDAAARVDALSDSEVAQLSGLVDMLPAGSAALTNDQLIVILLLIVILVLLL